MYTPLPPLVPRAVATPDASFSPSDSAYGYRPTAWVCLTFIAIFSVLLCAHIALAVRFKYWIVFPTLALGTVGEIIGWSGRYWSYHSLDDANPFMMQIASLIISPVFYSAYLYWTLGKIVFRYGQQYCVLSAKLFLAVFLVADVFSLVLQAIGGGWAASVAPAPAAATSIMLAGIALQLAVMLIFVAVGVDYALRLRDRRAYRRYAVPDALMLETRRGGAKETGVATPSPRVQETQRDGVLTGRVWLFFLAMAISSVCIIIRGVYRSAELGQGWEGEIIKNETLQNVLDGLMMVFAVGIFVPLNMGFLFPPKRSWRGAI